MSALVGLCQPIILMEWMVLDLFWNPISNTISLIKDENSRGKNVYIIPTEGLSQKKFGHQEILDLLMVDRVLLNIHSSHTWEVGTHSL